MWKSEACAGTQTVNTCARCSGLPVPLPSPGPSPSVPGTPAEDLPLGLTVRPPGLSPSIPLCQSQAGSLSWEEQWELGTAPWEGHRLPETLLSSCLRRLLQLRPPRATRPLSAQASWAPWEGAFSSHIQHGSHAPPAPFSVSPPGRHLTLASSVVRRSLMSLSRVQFIHSGKKKKEREENQSEVQYRTPRKGKPGNADSL